MVACFKDSFLLWLAPFLFYRRYFLFPYFLDGFNEKCPLWLCSLAMTLHSHARFMQPWSSLCSATSPYLQKSALSIQELILHIWEWRIFLMPPLKVSAFFQSRPQICKPFQITHWLCQSLTAGCFSIFSAQYFSI